MNGTKGHFESLTLPTLKVQLTLTFVKGHIWRPSPLCVPEMLSSGVWTVVLMTSILEDTHRYSMTTGPMRMEPHEAGVFICFIHIEIQNSEAWLQAPGWSLLGLAEGNRWSGEGPPAPNTSQDKPPSLYPGGFAHLPVPLSALQTDMQPPWPSAWSRGRRAISQHNPCRGISPSRPCEHCQLCYC